ncbi:hypothetical protein [uncultured Desulfosarcina sp.]|uniref:hypothetical protein n=1 Tax=uncultured Desulfosarcina sp. TaxID=218289 RepID=UPI0029C905E4|nr:hypothetical protein [uncultured Desulfosarcina sp.]
MGVDKKDLVNVLNTSVKELQQGIDMHCCLVTSILEGRLDENKLQPILDRCPKRSREIRLEKAIAEAIDVLEESRKAFKSKKIEGLRKQLTQVLIEVE